MYYEYIDLLVYLFCYIHYTDALEATTKSAVTIKRRTEKNTEMVKGTETTVPDTTEDSDVTDVSLAQREKKNKSPQSRTKQVKQHLLTLLLKTRTINVSII